MKLIFCMQINIKNVLWDDFNTLGIIVSYKVILSLLMDMIKHSQSTESNKFTVSLQYLKKEVRNGVHFLHANKHQFLQVAFIVFNGSGQTCPKYSKWEVGNFLQYTKKKVLRLILCSVVTQNIQIFYVGSVMFVVTCLYYF